MRPDRQRVRRFAPFGLSAFLAALPAGAQTPPEAPLPLPGRPSFEVMLEWPHAAVVAVSPDGSRVAFLVGSQAVHGPSEPAELRVWDEAGGTRTVATEEDGMVWEAEWTADGGALAFLSLGEEGPALRMIPVDGSGGSRSWPLDLPGVEGFSLSPHGPEAVLRVRDTVPAPDERLQAVYGPFTVDDAAERPVHLWLVSLEDGSTRRLTQGDFSVFEATWSPTRRELAVVTGPPLATSSWWRRDLWRLDAEGGALTALATERGSEEAPVWSPDGEHLAFLTTGADTITTAPPLVAVIPRTGGRPATLTDTLTRIPDLVAWDGHGIRLWLQDGATRAGFALLDPSGPGAMRWTTPDSLLAWPWSVAAGGGTLAYTAATGSTLDEVWVQAGPDGPARRITQLSGVLADLPLGRREVVRWTGPDGVPVDGVLHTPEDFDPTRRYPLLVMIHGGPRDTSFPRLVGISGVYPLLHFLWKGAVVLEPNYRGSIGYGLAFRELHHRQLGFGDGGDVLAGVQALVDQGFVDPERVGVMGWSYGGFLSAWLTVTSDAFTATSVGAGITDWRIHYAWEEEYLTTRFYSFGATPWQEPEAYRIASPLEYLEGASTPTLIQHVDGDPVVPALGARALYRGLKDHGVETRLILFPGEGHFPVDPKQVAAATWQNWQWFLRWLWGDEAQLPGGAS